MTIESQAAVLSRHATEGSFAAANAVRTEVLNLDAPGHGEVLVQVEAAGLCHSDLSVVTGVRARPLPMVLGHEGAEVVEALGGGVEDFAVGDHVVFSFVPACGRCVPCLSGRPALCEAGAMSNTAGTLLSGKQPQPSGREPRASPTRCLLPVDADRRCLQPTGARRQDTEPREGCYCSGAPSLPASAQWSIPPVFRLVPRPRSSGSEALWA